jgi:hypothetical protein
MYTAESNIISVVHIVSIKLNNLYIVILVASLNGAKYDKNYQVVRDFKYLTQTFKRQGFTNK